jgi:hypothetical protein
MVVKWTISLRIKTLIKKTYRFAAWVMECSPLLGSVRGRVLGTGVGDGCGYWLEDLCELCFYESACCFGWCCCHIVSGVGSSGDRLPGPFISFFGLLVCGDFIVFGEILFAVISCVDVRVMGAGSEYLGKLILVLCLFGSRGLFFRPKT